MTRITIRKCLFICLMVALGDGIIIYDSSNCTHSILRSVYSVLTLCFRTVCSSFSSKYFAFSEIGCATTFFLSLVEYMALCSTFNFMELRGKKEPFHKIYIPTKITHRFKVNLISITKFLPFSNDYTIF